MYRVSQIRCDFRVIQKLLKVEKTNTTSLSSALDKFFGVELNSSISSLEGA